MNKGRTSSFLNLEILIEIEFLKFAWLPENLANFNYLLISQEQISGTSVRKSVWLLISACSFCRPVIYQKSRQKASFANVTQLEIFALNVIYTLTDSKTIIYSLLGLVFQIHAMEFFPAIFWMHTSQGGTQPLFGWSTFNFRILIVNKFSPNLLITPFQRASYKRHLFCHHNTLVLGNYNVLMYIGEWIQTGELFWQSCQLIVWFLTFQRLCLVHELISICN